MNDATKGQVQSVLERKDREVLLQLAQGQAAEVLRYLTGRLCSADDREKWQAVWGLGVLVGDRQLVSREQVIDLLRRFFWMLNEESGGVPWGVPEAIGEILAVRPELRETFLPMLCSLVTGEEVLQTGHIERGALWALGRVGPPVARCSPEAVEALRAAAATHPDPETRQVAARSLASLANADAIP